MNLLGLIVLFFPISFFTRLRDASTERRNKAKTPEPGIASRDAPQKPETSRTKNVASKNVNNVRLAPVQ